MMRAKLSGFLDRPDTVARRYPLGDHSLPARYARAISTYRHSDLREAIAQIDGLIQTQPNNPYFYELKGQALLEGGHPAEAVAPLRHAVALAHGAPLIDIMLGQALIATNNTKLAEEAVPLLRCAMSREPEAPEAYTQLAMAYGRKGDLANADLASAQAAFTRGDLKTARQLATRAKTRLPVGSPAWVRADDIVSVKPPTAANQMTSARTKPMTSSPRPIAAVCAALLAVAAPQAVRAQNFSPAQRGEIERIVRDYLIAHPEVLQEAMAELEKRQTAAEAEKHKIAVKEHAQTLFSSPRQVTLGNPNGNVTFVEFFDYNCGYCKRAMDDMLTLLKNDPNLKVVLKEFPVLGPGSVEAAQVASRRAHAGQDRQEISRIPHQAARRPRSGRQGARARGGQGSRPGYGPAGKGHGQPRGEGHVAGRLQARRGARPQRHAELRDRLRRGGRRHRPCRPAGKDQHRALRQADLQLSRPIVA